MPKPGQIVTPLLSHLYNDDNRAVLPALGEGFADSVVTDPPYGLEFMGKGWDHGVPGVEFWVPILRSLLPGGYLLSFGGTRTFHRLTCAIEDAGFQIRDTIMWLYGSGFPKGQGCLKPAWEPIILARKPGKRVLPLGIDECRVPTDERLNSGAYSGADTHQSRIYRFGGNNKPDRPFTQPSGRYPANVCHDGSDEVLEAFAAFGDRGGPREAAHRPADGKGYCGLHTQDIVRHAFQDAGSAARFYYCAKASRSERGAGNTHPTVKPLALMRWLVRLVTPPDGVTLDPFAGSGSTGVAAVCEGRRFVGIENDREHGYFSILQQRILKAELLARGK